MKPLTIGTELDYLGTQEPGQLAFTPPQTSSGGVGLLTSVRNEGLGILEWIAYYRVLGVKHIVVYTNDNSDGSDELLAEMARLDLIHLVYNRVNGQVSPQLKSFRHAIAQHEALRSCEWTVMIDADEFIVPRLNGQVVPSLPDYLAQIRARFGASAISLNWKWFTGNLSLIPERDLCLNLYRSSVDNLHVKVMFRMEDVLDVHSAHSVILRSGTYGIYGAGRSMAMPAYKSPESIYDLGQINHYWQKSFAEYLLKLQRGSGAQGGETIIRKTEEFFSWWGPGRDDQLPTDAVRILVLRELSRLRTLGKISDLEDKIWTRFHKSVRGNKEMANLYLKHLETFGPDLVKRGLREFRKEHLVYLGKLEL